MSETKSPFLNDGENKDNKSPEQIATLGTSPEGRNNKSPFGGSVVGVDSEVKAKSVVDTTKNLSGPDSSSAETGTLEIKEDGKILRNIIIVLIVLLVLALLGLVGYNVLNKGNGAENIKVLKEESRVETGNFEMKGERFKASSIVIEQ